MNRNTKTLCNSDMTCIKINRKLMTCKNIKQDIDHNYEVAETEGPIFEEINEIM